MFVRIASVAVMLVSSGAAPAFAQNAPSEPDPAALRSQRVELLTAQVRNLLAAPSPTYPDPWRARRDRPHEFAVLAGETMTYAQRLTAMGLAGLANRQGPRLFIRGHFDFNADADRFWLARLADQYGMSHREVAFDEALHEFHTVARGAVICDEQLPATEVVALTLAGAFQLVPALPEMETSLRAAGIPVTLDLRGAWQDPVSAQQWCFDLVGSRMSDQLIGLLDVRGRALWGIADYLVMHGALVADLSSDRDNHPDEFALRDKAFARLQEGGLVWGWTCHDTEALHVDHASRRGLRVLCATNCPNLSLLAQVRPAMTEYRQRSPAPASRPVEKKLYLTFVLSDGDSIPILLTRQWYRWDDPARGTVPFGWEHQPLLADLAPVVFEYYYQTMTDKDRLICGPSGAGYTHPGAMPNLDWFVAQSRDYLRRTDLHCIGVCADWHVQAAESLLEGVPEAIGGFHGWGEEPDRKLLLVRGKPYVPYWLCPGQPDQSPHQTKDDAYYAQEAAKIRRLVARAGLPCFVAAHLSCYWSTPSDVPRLLAALGPDIPHEVLLPDQFLQSLTDYHQDQIVLEPIDPVPLMRGATASLVLKLTSTRAQGTDCLVRLEPPAGAAVDPPSTTVHVEAFGTAQVPVEIRAEDQVTGRTLRATLDFAGRASEYQLAVDVVPPAERLPDGLALVSVWQADRLAHSTGAAVDDPAAHSGTAWQALPDQHRPAAHLAWGPYEELPPGRYAVAFRLKATGRAGTPVARLDVFNYGLSEQGQNGVYAEAMLQAEDLAGSGQYADYWLEFEQAVVGKVEYRVWWPGQLPLSLDRVVVCRKR